jgi:hypothetical protein
MHAGFLVYDSNKVRNMIRVQPKLNKIPLKPQGISVPYWFALVGLSIMAFVVRYLVARQAYRVNFDSSTVGLMALDILRGERPLFFYGQNYMGSLEAYVAAPLIALLGVSNLSLALSPALFTSGWVFFTFWLFRDLLTPKVGMAAACCIALPGWSVLWYSINALGGYPAAFMLGTAALWFCVRLDRYDLNYATQFLHIILIGLFAGLALWTNFQSAIYLVLGVAFLVRFMHREEWSIKLWIAGLAGLFTFAIAILPVFLARNETTGSHVVAWGLDGSGISASLLDIGQRHMPSLLLGIGEFPAVYVILRLCIYTIAPLLLAWSVYSSLRRWRLILPAVYVGVFLLFYLPNPMAQEGALRYLISAWTMLTIGLLAIPTIKFKFAPLLLGLWLAMNAYEITVSTSRAMARTQTTTAAQQKVAHDAHAIGARTVHMSDGYIFGHHGQTYGWMAANRIQFVSNFDERRQDRAQQAEVVEQQTIGVPTEKFDDLRHTLNSLGVAHARTNTVPVSFFYNITPRREHLVSCYPQAATTLDGRTATALIDRTYDTDIECSGFTLDLGRPLNLGKIWLSAKGPYQQTLPESFAISVSTNGVEYVDVHVCPGRVPVAYTQENMVYVKGFYGVMECAMNQSLARYVRLTAKKPTTISINEVFVFEHRGEAQAIIDEEILSINSHLREQRIGFLATDRWLSAQLYPNSFARVFPRYNSKFLKTQRSRILKPENGVAIAVRAGLEGETSRVIQAVYGLEAIKQVIGTAHYRILVLQNIESPAKSETRLLWNGHTLLRLSGKEPAWY